MVPGPDKQFDTEQALDKAMQVFWAHGYEAASLSELTAKMGIGKKSLYDTYGNKRALFLQSLDRYMRIQYDRIRSILQREGSPLGNVRDWLRETARWNQGNCSRGCLIGNNMADFDADDAEVAGRLAFAMQSVENLLTETLQRARDQGELSDRVRPRDAARMLVCLLQGMALISRVNEDETMFSDAATAALTLLQKRRASRTR